MSCCGGSRRRRIVTNSQALPCQAPSRPSYIHGHPSLNRRCNTRRVSGNHAFIFPYLLVCFLLGTLACSQPQPTPAQTTADASVAATPTRAAAPTSTPERTPPPANTPTVATPPRPLPTSIPESSPTPSPAPDPSPYTRANSYVDSPSVPDTGTNGCAESHGYASPYGNADSATPADGLLRVRLHYQLQCRHRTQRLHRLLSRLK